MYVNEQKGFQWLWQYHFNLHFMSFIRFQEIKTMRYFRVEYTTEIGSFIFWHLFIYIEHYFKVSFSFSKVELFLISIHNSNGFSFFVVVESQQLMDCTMYNEYFIWWYEFIVFHLLLHLVCKHREKKGK